jgi:lysophospholipid acyltransferase (LPLAT)-like uncharacterized protein
MRDENGTGAADAGARPAGVPVVPSGAADAGPQRVAADAGESCSRGPSSQQSDASARTASGGAAGATAARTKRKKGPVRRALRDLRRTVTGRLSFLFAPTLLRGLAGSWKVTVLDQGHLRAARDGGRGHFMALWHGRMLLGLAHHASPGEWSVLVSRSADGDVTERMLEAFRYQVIRGSSSRGGARALREMLGVLEAGRNLVITPDGPRGPRHSMSPGLTWMARATGCAIVPCGFVCDRAWRLNSWDRFTIPKRGARVVLAYGEPVRVSRDASPQDLEAAGVLVRERILDAERRGFALLATEPDW